MPGRAARGAARAAPRESASRGEIHAEADAARALIGPFASGVSSRLAALRAAAAYFSPRRLAIDSEAVGLYSRFSCHSENGFSDRGREVEG
jgi:hypothetical protein